MSNLLTPLPLLATFLEVLLNPGLPLICARYPPTSRTWMLHFCNRGWLRSVSALILGLQSPPHQLSLTGSPRLKPLAGMLHVIAGAQPRGWHTRG